MSVGYYRVFPDVKSKREGRAWVSNGEIYYSLNSMRGAPIPEHCEEMNLEPGKSKASDFQEPVWWERSTEWLGFVIRQPVPYSGSLVEALNAVPDRLLCVSNKGIALSGKAIGPWKHLESLLEKLADLLQNKLPQLTRYQRPFLPSKWGYDQAHATHEEASAHIEAGRDWFAMWLGYVYWLSQKIIERSEYRDSLAPMWFLHIIHTFNDQLTLDLIRTTPLLQNQWKWNRVGVWLHNPRDVADQPTAQWFVDRGVPVWYRWGASERTAARANRNFSLIVPEPEELQLATTWIAPYYNPSLNSSSAFAFSEQNHSIESRPRSPPPSFGDGAGDDASRSEPTATMSTSSQPGVAPWSKPTLKPPHVDNSAVAAKRTWDEFWTKCEALHEVLLKKETKQKKEQRLDRERKKLTVSAVVYKWGWDDDVMPPVFKRSLVRKADRADMLINYRKEIRHYDAHLNEWHCCYKFIDEWYTESPSSSATSSLSQENAALPATHGGDAAESSTSALLAQRESAPVWSSKDENRAPCPSQRPQPLPLPPSLVSYEFSNSRSGEFKMERTRTEVVRLLSQRFGFVPPLPVPLAVAGTILETDMKSLLSVLGMDGDKASLDFFRKGADRPSPDLWDISRDNRHTLAFSTRVSAIQMMWTSDGKTWYVFDMGLSRTVPWNIAVVSTADALYVCRLDSQMTEEAIVLDLAEGVRFHTVQHRDELPSSRPDRSASTYVPLRLSGHVFNQWDYDFYHKQTECILSLPRARAAIMHGGFARRIAIDYLSISETARGPRDVDEQEGHMFTVRDASGVEYVDDDLTTGEFDVLCGLYVTFTGYGKQVGKLSWYPLTYVFEGHGEDMGWWTGRAEKLWQSINTLILSSDPMRKMELLKNVMKWRDKVKGFGDGWRALKSVEDWSREFLIAEIGESDGVGKR
ncbi:hypothetical protein NP233_g10976 [Leucocoprinus birnbaumii]|uniref:Uncharacterized protein n=1 Tax=Leucocoprinus birnbaumii TaxID=56174 RepID=A0AAD5YRD4_9AGAR|nr:hypothetical protein NP233_g10976 [Leucocoprinus birnbaumii]